MEKKLQSLFNYFYIGNKSNSQIETSEESSKNTSYLSNEYKEEQDYSYLHNIPMFSKILVKASKQDKSTQLRVYYILDLISQGAFNSIENKQLQLEMFNGIPDELPGLRTLLWKLSLGFPKEAKIIHSPKWQEEVDLLRNNYFETKRTLTSFLTNFSSIQIKSTDPLSNSSEWDNYLQDLELLEEIERDVRRTRAQMSFFFMPVDPDQEISNNDISFKADQIREPTRKSKEKVSKFECHCDVLTRILFIYAKNYPELKYVQGMNEVLAPIYYQFCLNNDVDNNIYKQSNNDESTETKQDLKDHEKVEADSYFCFVYLMNEIKDLFIREKDEQRSGIQTKIKGVNNLLRSIDKELYKHFEDLGIEIQYFMFRWYALLFTQEYELPDVMRLWDSILSFSTLMKKSWDKFIFLDYLCIAIMLFKKEEIVKQDFATTMLSFQSFDTMEVTKHIGLARNLRTKYSGFMVKDN